VFPINLLTIAKNLFPLVLVLVSMCCVGCNVTATGHNIHGKRLFEQGQYAAALQEFQKATASNPNDADAFYNMASTYHRMGSMTNNQQHFQQAEDLYNQCLNINENHVDCHRGLAVLLVETNRADRAFTLLRNWATWSPNNSDAHIELSRLYHEFGKRDVARQYLEHAVQVDQGNSRAWRALAMMREEAGDMDQALANYHRSYQLNGMQPDVAARIAALQHSRNSRLSTTPGSSRWVTPTVPRSRY
jgi:tetratricopeptide (TPR) repeat protein